MEEGERPWFLTVADGVTLDGVMHEKQGQASLIVILLHPMAQLGGSMHDPVTASLFRAMSRCSEVSHVLRYDRRGVGDSSGRQALWADTDCADLLIICRKLKEAEAASKLWVVGYSWGSVISAHAATFEEVDGVICISPPAGFFSNLLLQTHTHYHKLASPDALAKPKFIVTGSDDGIASLSSVKAMVQSINVEVQNQTHESAGPVGPQADALAVEMVVEEQAGHFWMGSNVQNLIKQVVRFLKAAAR